MSQNNYHRLEVLGYIRSIIGGNTLELNVIHHTRIVHFRESDTNLWRRQVLALKVM